MRRGTNPWGGGPLILNFANISEKVHDPLDFLDRPLH